MKKKIKVDKELIIKLKPYWNQLQNIENEFYRKVYKLEKEMSKEVGIKNLEFFMCDNSHVGIGNLDRTMRLIQRDELEKEK